ncbi:preprotein translocase subunit YajC [Saccharothrix algeriensis]|uniref:Preprotein translocase subunit YajC n=1 Tax=Saccharothrix algeriensis TaxID=173560 RepID=A0ABS2S1W3_9PSEU|nr:preprotein translocase subunit YajC [Saccharothrix algeriensis]
MMFPLLLVLLAVPLFLSARKQKKAVAEQQALLNSLEPGDRVMTTSGLYATVADASDDTTIDLEIADGVVTTWLRQAVREKVVADVDDTDAVVDDTADVDEPAAVADEPVRPAQQDTKK